MDRPSFGSTEAVYQAGATIGTYLSQAIEEIDSRLGEGYAKNHPELIAECVRSQTMDFNMTALTAVLYEIGDALEARKVGGRHR